MDWKVVRWSVALAALTLLAGCRETSTGPASEPGAIATVNNPSGITLSDARVQLPLVSGRPGVAYFNASQATGAPLVIAAVDIAMVGRAEMHESRGETMKPVESIVIGAGRTIKFEPGGHHAMLFDLDPKLRFAKDVELTVTFDNGRKATARATVTTMAEMMEGEH